MPDKHVEPVTLLRDAAEAVREFNHLTFPTRQNPGGLAYPPEAYRAIGALKALSQRLPQAFEQIVRALTVPHERGYVTADYGTPETHIATASAALQEAHDLAHALAAALERAHTATSPLGYSGPITDTDVTEGE
ncbi:hypothetical protein AB0Q95_32510 [Streptomyces sp. NPDC059900]|uniref:hypothetical protein n=1 Tax=Streptomyces sp. NPDC059900 TaxID=3155816 RepID=UPI003412CBCF